MSRRTPTPDERTYQAAITALFSRRPEHMVPGLERIVALCEALGSPQDAAPVIHLTGTNGKTTLARMVSSLLEAHGTLAGTYTSPHLQDVRERVRVGGRPVDRADFVADLEALAPFIEAVEAERGELVTFFETLTALAYRRFALDRVDASVVEVGMGGRWDATNVADAAVAVINPIRLDHAELGTTVAEVAAEKAGIIAPGTTCVVAAQEESAAHVIRAEARRQDARLLVAGRDFAVDGRRSRSQGQALELRLGGRRIDEVFLPLLGVHQAENAAVALASVAALRGDVDDDAVRRGFAGVHSPGRLEVVGPEEPAPVVLDGAHNPAGAQALARALGEEFGRRHTVLVLGVMGDKDCQGILEALLPVAGDVVATEAPTGRAAPAERVGKLCRLSGREALVEPDAASALAAARDLAPPGGLVVVTGSLYLVGAVRELLGLAVT